MTDAERTELESALEIVYGIDRTGIDARVKDYAFNPQVQELATMPAAALIAAVQAQVDAAPSLPRYTSAAALMRLYAAIRFALERDAAVTQ